MYKLHARMPYQTQRPPHAGDIKLAVKSTIGRCLWRSPPASPLRQSFTCTSCRQSFLERKELVYHVRVNCKRAIIGYGRFFAAIPTDIEHHYHLFLRFPELCLLERISMTWRSRVRRAFRAYPWDLMQSRDPWWKAIATQRVALRSIEVSDPQVSLAHASEWGAIQGVGLILKKHPSLLNKFTALGGEQFGSAPLHRAARRGHAGLVRFFLQQRRTQVNTFTVGGSAPIHDAVANRHRDVVRVLISAPDIDMNGRFQDHPTPLQIAVANSDAEMTMLLLTAPNIDVNAATSDGYTPLHNAVLRGDVLMVKLLLTVPTMPVNKNADALAILANADALAHNANADALANNTKVDAVTVQTKKNLPLQIGVNATTKKLPPQLDVNATTTKRYSALHFAARDGRVGIVKMLLSARHIDASGANRNGDTALHFAVLRGLSATVKLLVRHPTVDVNAKNGRGFTALHYAAQVGSIRIMRVLLSVPEVDVTCATHRGDTALRLATRHGSGSMIELLM